MSIIKIGEVEGRQPKTILELIATEDSSLLLPFYSDSFVRFLSLA